MDIFLESDHSNEQRLSKKGAHRVGKDRDNVFELRGSILPDNVRFLFTGKLKWRMALFMLIVPLCCSTMGVIYCATQQYVLYRCPMLLWVGSALFFFQLAAQYLNICSVADKDSGVMVQIRYGLEDVPVSFREKTELDHMEEDHTKEEFVEDFLEEHEKKSFRAKLKAMALLVNRNAETTTDDRFKKAHAFCMVMFLFLCMCAIYCYTVMWFFETDKFKAYFQGWTYYLFLVESAIMFPLVCVIYPTWTKSILFGVLSVRYTTDKILDSVFTLQNSEGALTHEEFDEYVFIPIKSWIENSFQALTHWSPTLVIVLLMNWTFAILTVPTIVSFGDSFMLWSIILIWTGCAVVLPAGFLCIPAISSTDANRIKMSINSLRGRVPINFEIQGRVSELEYFINKQNNERGTGFTFLGIVINFQLMATLTSSLASAVFFSITYLISTATTTME